MRSLYHPDITSGLYRTRFFGQVAALNQAAFWKL